jgi:dTMP kinase
MSEPLPYGRTSEAQARSVLSIPAFRRLWVALSLSSLGDWLGLLAVTALARELAADDYAKANFAIAGVFIVRLLPAVFIGPLAGVIADRFDRRRVMVIGDLLRGGLFLTIPFFPNYFWLYTATILIEAVTLFWSPAKEASVPNIVPRSRLEGANQLSLLATYGTAPVAAVLFTILALISGSLAGTFTFFEANPVNLALYLNAASFFFGAYTIARLRVPLRSENEAKAVQASFFTSLTDGWKFIGTTPHIRALIIGILGAFAAGGAVIGLARTYVGDLGGGDAAYGVLFGAVFLGLAGGMGLGPRLLRGFSRRRLFGLALTIAGICLTILALVANLPIAIFTVVVLGFYAGLAWVSGFTMLGLEVKDEVRGRTFAFVQSLIRVTLVLVLAVAPLLAAAIGVHSIRFRNIELNYNGAEVTLLLGGLLATAMGVISYRQMDDRKGISLIRDLFDSLRGELGAIKRHNGLLIALEGGEGTGKSTQAKRLQEWFEAQGREVLLTFEPGGTPLGQKLRALLLDVGTGNIAPRAEAMLYAADRAEHVATVIQPMLDRGGVVITDRYMDSSIAYQGAGRDLDGDEVARISRWATGGLYPDLTIVIDVEPKVALDRFDTAFDRLEQEPLDFHERVRKTFLALAAMEPARYLVVDGTQSPDQIFTAITGRTHEMLKDYHAGQEQ